MPKEVHGPRNTQGGFRIDPFNTAAAGSEPLHSRIQTKETKATAKAEAKGNESKKEE